MKPLMPPINTPDNLFHDGNPATGQQGTIVTAEHLNNEQGSIRDVQNELIAILTAAKMVPESTAGQLLEALGKLYSPASNTLGALAALVGAANKLPYFTGPTAASLTDLTQVGRDIIGKTSTTDILAYLGLGTAAKKNVGTGAGQLPDMSNFTAGSSSAFRLPTGHIVQFDTGTVISGGFTKSYPIPFPTTTIVLIGMVFGSTGFTWTATPNTFDRTAANINFTNSSGNALTNQPVGYLAIGY